MKYFIAIPVYDKVDPYFLKSLLGLHKPSGTAIGLEIGTNVYDARNELTKKAIEYGADRVLWLDSDMVFDPTMLDTLATDCDEGRDYVSALYFSRKNPIGPVLFKGVRYEEEDSMTKPVVDVYEDYPRDSIFPIAASGFGAVMTSVSLLQKVYNKFGAPFTPIPGFGEDVSFGARCNELGETIYCDSRINPAHGGEIYITEDTFDKHITL
jgi:hypothetical protein